MVGEKKQENVESKDDVKCATVEPAADSTKEEDEKAAPTIPTVKKEEMETNTAAASSGTPLGIIAPKPKRSADVMKADAAIEQHESDDDAQEINGLICRGRKFRVDPPAETAAKKLAMRKALRHRILLRDGLSQAGIKRRRTSASKLSGKSGQEDAARRVQMQKEVANREKMLSDCATAAAAASPNNKAPQ